MINPYHLCSKGKKLQEEKKSSIFNRIKARGKLRSGFRSKQGPSGGSRPRQTVNDACLLGLLGVNISSNTTRELTGRVLNTESCRS